MSSAPSAPAALANAQSIAPPSFAGMDWLLVINLMAAIFGLLVLSFAARDIWRAWWRDRARDARNSAAELMRRILGLMLVGETLRALSDVLALYGWSPATQSSGGWATAGRFLDPIGFALLIAGAVLLLMTQRGLLGQLRTKPLFLPIWEERDTIIRLCLFAAAALVLALCPVILR